MNEANVVDEIVLMMEQLQGQLQTKLGKLILLGLLTVMIIFLLEVQMIFLED